MTDLDASIKATIDSIRARLTKKYGPAEPEDKNLPELLSQLKSEVEDEQSVQLYWVPEWEYVSVTIHDYYGGNVKNSEGRTFTQALKNILGEE